MSVSIIIVHFHVESFLENCIKSILRTDNKIVKEIIIVNNGSNRKLAFKNKKITVINNIANMGFAKANNIGITKAIGKYFLLLNPDTVLMSHTLSKCVDYLDSHPFIAILGCKILNSDGTLQSSCRNYPSMINILIEALGIHDILNKKNISISNYTLLWDHNSVRNIDSVKGAFLLIRKEIIPQVGMLDGKYFMYGEEVDFCKRVKEKGWNIIFYPHAQIIHYGGKSTEINSLKNMIELHRSQRYYCRKHMSENIALICISLYFLGLIFRIFFNLPLPWYSSVTRQTKRNKAIFFYNTAKSYFN